MSTQTTPRNKFRERVREIAPSDRIETFDKYPDKLYLFPSESGFGITSDCYKGLDARLIESIGMDSLSEDHRLHRPYAHHVLIFKVE